MNDYERIAAVIRHLNEHHLEQPDLAALAAVAGLSAHHFHRLFTRWAGVTPKDFLQCLTSEFARKRLRQGQSVLDAALDAGLSSPGRLHDLCITLEAATPGEVKSGGRGMELTVGLADTPFGIACIASSPRGICHLGFMENDDLEAAEAELRQSWPHAELRWEHAAARQIAAKIFQTDQGADLKVLVRGTPFQLRVWRALLRIPVGAAVSYGHIARAIGNPGAARAVGTAVGCNPISYLIPCHRVIRETGIIGQYRWGHERKCVMLGREWVSDLLQDHKP